MTFLFRVTVLHNISHLFAAYYETWIFFSSIFANNSNDLYDIIEKRKRENATIKKEQEAIFVDL